jgi:hypothetical protein
MADSLAVPATTPRSLEGCSMKEAEKKDLQQQRCQSWLQSKRRLCASPAMPGSQLRTTPPCNSIFKHPFFNVYPHSKSFLIVVTTLNLCCIFLIAVTILN